MLVNGSIQPPPLAFDLHKDFIDSPRVTSRTQMPTAAYVQLRSISLDPSVDGRMINSQATFLSQFFYIPVTEGVAAVPTDTANDDGRHKVPPLEQARLGHEETV
jgi:hypothetical protein